MNSPDFTFVTREERIEQVTMRKSLTYWQDVWRRLKINKMAMVGLVGVVFIVLTAIISPFFFKQTYSDQNPDYSNLPPRLSIYKVADDYFVYFSRDYKLLRINQNGHVLYRLKLDQKDNTNKIYTYVDTNSGENMVIAVDFSWNLLPGKIADYDFVFIVNDGDTGEISAPYKKVPNKTYPFGSDIVGRSLLIRVVYGARISLSIALIAVLVNLLIGVIWGSVAAWEGGWVDNVMMRIVDFLNSIPLIIYVILIMVLVGNRGLWTMALTLGSVYWVVMARLVRGQVLTLREQEFVLAAVALGVSKRQIILRHLIPNAMGPIIVTMTMRIPSAVFAEAFIGFIGLGVSAPMASWGTLANDALTGFLSYPYQLFYPSLAIAITMLSFNFLGDGLRDALDPRLRKG